MNKQGQSEMVMSLLKWFALLAFLGFMAFIFSGMADNVLNPTLDTVEGTLGGALS